MKFYARMLAGVAMAALAFGVLPWAGHGIAPLAQAQNLGQRAVSGVVKDSDSANVPGAIVYLRNPKNKSIRTYTSTKDGRFHFVQVNMSDDYDLWAEKDGKKSAIKTVSSWDTRKEVECELKINK